MKITIKDKKAVLPLFTRDEINKMILELISGNIMKMYDAQGTMFQILLDQFARKLLYDAEKKVYELTKDKEKAKELRPQEGESPSEKYIKLMLGGLYMVLQDAQIELICNDDGEIAAFTYSLAHQGEAGRQLVDTGQEGEREDDVRKAADKSASKVVPHKSPVHTRHKAQRL